MITQNWSWNRNFFYSKIKSSCFKQSGQVSSAILPACKTIKKNIQNKIKRISVLIRNGTTPFAIRRNTCIKSTRISCFLWLKVKYGTKCLWEKLQKSFVDNSNFIRGSTETAIRGCFGIDSKENRRSGNSLSNLFLAWFWRNIFVLLYSIT